MPNHRGEYPLPGDAERPPCDTCPGYLIALPQVADVTRALPWWERGQLRDFLDDEAPTEPIRLYLDVLRVTRDEVEAAHYAEMRRDRG